MLTWSILIQVYFKYNNYEKTYISFYFYYKIKTIEQQLSTAKVKTVLKPLLAESQQNILNNLFQMCIK